LNVEHLAGYGSNDQAGAGMDARREFQARKSLSAWPKDQSTVHAFEHNRPAPGSVWSLVGQHGVSRPLTGLRERRFECIALPRQNVALGVEGVGDFVKVVCTP
jgi:hypothetical protein